MGGMEDEAVEPELFVVELDVEPSPDATVDAEDVAEGDRERGTGDTEEEGVDVEATDSVGATAGTGRGCFRGRPRGRLALMVSVGDANEDEVEGTEASVDDDCSGYDGSTEVAK